jgi:hypothetical protein
VLTFLESVGRRSEAEFYLRLFRKLPKQSFALIVVAEPVVEAALGSLVQQLRFLADLGLQAPVILGALSSEPGGRAAQRLSSALPAAELEPSRASLEQPDLAEVVTRSA